MAPGTPPRHIACIMAGNGRWARQRGLERTHGELASENAFRTVVRTAWEEDVEWLTLLTGAGNRARPGEDGAPGHFVAQHLLGHNLERLHDEGVRVRVLVPTDPALPEATSHRLREAEERTRGNSRRNLTIAFEPGGRQDILDAARALVSRQVPAYRVTEATFSKYMRCPELPDVDLLLRTGGEHRISNVLLWHCAHAELVFFEILWPDFRAEHLRYALDIYRRRRRRSGQVPADPAPHQTAALPAGEGLLSKLLHFPGTLATHLGLVLMDGLRETADYANSRPGQTRTRKRLGDADRWSR
ncbi:polyprenyl diphosphate synthase [Streptomyces spirodelae]|uniref:Isoprenyl transferase n=1 Tax=Streptomyces spirodelae TaxID=2812904 RepID=A0ABS3WPV7_9ACTN|nr:polyprenyl diphosphate synthase [Streptomyces spirodelae]MBO8185150.1 di-trans,poly-cis-decaprenylcistransferase [Streptomyces spirodelae]